MICKACKLKSLFYNKSDIFCTHYQVEIRLDHKLKETNQYIIRTEDAKNIIFIGENFKCPYYIPEDTFHEIREEDIL